MGTHSHSTVAVMVLWLLRDLHGVSMLHYIIFVLLEPQALIVRLGSVPKLYVHN